MSMMLNRERQRIGLALLVLVPLGFYVKYGVTGAFQEWGHRYGAAVLYEIFWILFLRFWWPRKSPRFFAVTVFLATSVLEILQLWHPPWLQALRRAWLGAVLLGTDFDPYDFFYYALGSTAGGFLLQRFLTASQNRPNR